MNIHALINLGYTAADILGVLSKKGGNAGKKITRALSLGYSAPTILNVLLGGKHSDESFMTLEEKAKNNFQKQTRSAATKAGLTAAGAIGGISALRYGAGLAGLAREANRPSEGPPNHPLGPLQGPDDSPQGPLQGPDAPSMQGPPNNPLKIFRPPENRLKIMRNKPIGPMPTAAQMDIINRLPSKNVEAGEKLTKQFPQVEQFIKKHMEAGKTPDQTYNLFKASKTLSMIGKKYEERTGESLKSFIEGMYKQSKKPSKKELFDNVNTLKSLMEGLKEW